MTHALILGNSHTVALRHAWSAVGERHPRHRIDFFVAPQPQFKYLRGDGRVFGAPTGRAERLGVTRMVQRLNGRVKIDVTDFDLVVLVGFGNPYTQLAELMLASDIDGLREVGAPTRLSRAAFDAICQHIAEASMNANLFKRVAARPLVLLERSRPDETCLRSEDPRYAAFRSIAASPEGVDAVLTAYSAVFATVVAEMGATVIPQPRETIQPNGLTAARFSLGSISLTGGQPHPEGDHLHLNAAYGEICLAHIFDYLDSLGAPALAARS